MWRALPLIGRAEEVAFLRDAVTKQRGAVVGGAAGVGKTRLAREVADAFGDWFVAWTSVTPAAGALPLGGLAGLGLGEGSGLLESRPGLFERLSAELTGRAGTRPVLVVVDDAHLLDGLSAAFLHQLVVSGTASVLLTVRRDRKSVV